MQIALYFRRFPSQLLTGSQSLLATPLLRAFACVLLATGLTSYPGSLLAQNHDPDKNDDGVKVITPKKKVKKAETAEIDTEKMQAGIYFGQLAVEDFNTNPVVGLSFNYQLRQNIILQLNYASSKVGRATFEDVVGGNFLASSDRNFQYINLAGGYRLFSARSFLGSKRKYDSDIYVLGGLSAVDFAGESNTGLTLGLSYRIVLTDWLVSTLDFRNHIVNRDFLDDDKLTQNVELGIGFNALF